jgi:prepilin-type N-terminal cleavage/methylation domain-containing protein
MKREAGFTLIELLCALTILALVLGVSLRILSGGAANAAASRDYGRALAVAEAHLAAMRTTDRLAAGQIQGMEGRILWREKVTRAEDPAFANAAAAKLLAWRIDSVAIAPDGRKVALSSVKLEQAP